MLTVIQGSETDVARFAPAKNDAASPIIWHGCYNDGWKGVIAPDAFAHPAKFSRGLIKRIYDHMLARGYVRRGDVIGDPFGGIGTGGLEAAYRGLRWLGVELEIKFVGLATMNFLLHQGKWDTLGLPRPMIRQGDARRFDQIVDGVVTSPPYAETPLSPDRNFKSRKCPDRPEARSANREGYSAVVTSPPYSDISAGAGGLNTKPAKKAGQQSGRKNGASQETDQRYGDDPGQIAKLQDKGVEAVITSPPYADQGQRSGCDLHPDRCDGTNGGGSLREGYGESPKQIGTLREGRVDTVVTSPPYEEGLGHGGGKAQEKLYAEKSIHSQATDQYGASNGQIGRDAGEIYWQAMLQVYSACYRSIKPGGYVAVVVKDYVKNKARVPLCDDTLRLLIHVGFTPVERIHAMLVEETTHAALFGADHVVKKERKSFFRRLAEKNGSPPIDYEEILICRKLDLRALGLALA